MNLYNKLKISYKLALAFGFCILALGGLVVYNYLQIQRLYELQVQASNRARDAIVAASALNAGIKLYRTIANSELNINIVSARYAWSSAKAELKTKLNDVDRIALTAEEKNWAKKARADLESAIKIYENDMLSALEEKKTLSPEIRQMDNQINALVTTGTTPLTSIYASIAAESVARDQAFEAAQASINRTLTLAASIAIFFTIFLAVGIPINLNHNLQRVMGAVQGLATGDLSQRARVNSRDEIGQLAQGFNSMADQLSRVITSQDEMRAHIQKTIDQYVEYMDLVSTGNLSTRLALQGNGRGETDPLLVLGCGLNEMIDSFAHIIGQIRDASNNLSTASAEILAATTQQAAGANEQSAAIAQTTTTVDEVKAIGEQAILRAQEVVEASNRTVEVSRDGQTTVSETIDSMGRIKERVQGIAENILVLSEQTQQIGEIITTVSEIAAQSNMLALNASVEAARAGEHGKGFAVVAAEVRNLAEQSRQATVQVKAILQDIQRATNVTVMATEEGTKVVEQGVRLVARTSESLGQLSGVINESTQRAAQVMAGGRQQSTGVEQIAVAMQNINQATIQSLASTRQAEHAAQDLNTLAQALNDLVKRYEV